MVKQTTAANVAMFLVVLGWSLAFYGAMSQLGDFPPSMPRSHIEAVRHFSLAILFGEHYACSARCGCRLMHLP